MAMFFRFGTYNVQHFLNYEKRLRDPAVQAIEIENAADVILGEGLDICALQEIDVHTKRCGGVHQLEALLQLLSAKTGENWQGHFAKAIPFGGGEYGVALVSRYPITGVCTRAVGLSDAQKTGGRFEDRVLLTVSLEVEGQPLTVINTHFGLMPAEQDLSVQYITEALQTIDTPVLLAGDFNVEPDDPHIAVLCRVLTPAAAPDAMPLSYPSDVPDRTIDYIFSGNGVSVTGLRAVATCYSDHRPLVAQVAFS